MDPTQASQLGLTWPEVLSVGGFLLMLIGVLLKLLYDGIMSRFDNIDARFNTQDSHNEKRDRRINRIMVVLGIEEET